MKPNLFIIVVHFGMLHFSVLHGCILYIRLGRTQFVTFDIKVQ